ncbi:hypothetical protein PHYSODRAFT_310759 [Phytophthora sojae]|uniref:Uncharacterized protein n=1 Tax=Phytophthora sojae (strain P6497) TaxID=1094619 RepID=G4Z0Z0_PHYSP|nr:hypothetical protein PHYSODRAFT_310759 [Phytophthora sojae]EGZ23415.1 hypothetical protein PHYSODRAFT_310759 [Phytophthora sojae]|eukprot:XP_009518703.1 hypothetical protein PHYSODRAFT_310759 [Phytophthora sojae]
MKAISSLLSASALALLSTQGARAYSEGFDLTDHTSQLNFYHQAATDLTAEQVVLDDSCVVDQVHLLKFLKTWNLSELIPNPAVMVDNITTLGLQEAHDVGSTFRSKYAGLYTAKETVWTNAKERVVRTAQNFMNGFHGQDWDADLLVQVSTTDTTLGANTLTPIDTLAGRLDESLWPGFGFSAGVTLTVMDLCMYQCNYLGKDHLEFCQIFTDDEWKHYAYHKDLGYYYGSGYGAALAPTVGYPYSEAVTKLLNETETTSCQKIFLNAMYSGFGLNYDESYPTNAINATRNFRSSRVVTMGARLVTERITCAGESFIRFSINEEVVPLPGCQSGPGLTCPIAEFVQYMEARKAEVGDFITTCNSTSASSELTLFENPVVNQCAASSTKAGKQSVVV